MQVKIFESPDMATGLKMIRRELGPEALILSTRTVRNGRLGILGKPTLEITAAVDNRVDSAPLESPARQPATRSLHGTARQAYLEQTRPEAPSQPAPDERLSAPRALRKPAATRLAAEAPTDPPTDKQRDVSRELGELKEMVSALSGELSRMSSRPEHPTAPPDNGGGQAAFGAASAAQRDPVAGYLLAYDISPENAATIAGFARESLSFADLSRSDVYTAFLRDTIGGLIDVQPPAFTSAEGQQRIALVGPTGVGKTTTLAKIAAACLSVWSPSIALITIDTYRIAAVEQLKVYGEIMRLPVEVVISPAQLDAALERHADSDLILVDTAGRSPRDSVCIEELASFLTAERGFEKHLVLSAVTREKELLDTIEQFGRLGIDRTIFTKLDECRTLGVLLNVQISNPAPLSFLTNGQRVPEDLLQIDRETVSRLILPAGEGNQQ
ncbi:MAG: flagellar biosynthesis protein FlhF [Desulfobulbaceae bacterium]|nr:flagellar biosynthesis protein FlhF [Desulfobulbaceae bacterium]